MKGQRWQLSMWGAIGILGIVGWRSMAPSFGEPSGIAPVELPPADLPVLLRPSPAPPAVTPSTGFPSPAFPSPAFPGPAFPGPDSRPVPSRLATLNSQQLDQQLRTYLRYLRELGTPDILIVGSSRALQGIDPIALRQALAQQGYPDRKIYNFGINGATAQVVEFLLTELLTPAQLPRLILWADGVRAFNSGRIDQTHRRILASPGYRQVRSGMSPMLFAEAIAAPLCQDIPLAQLTQHLMGTASLGPPPPVRLPLLDLCRPFLQLLAQPEQATDPSLVRQLQQSLGFHPLSDRFQPPLYFQRHPRVPGAYDGDYRRFNLVGHQTQALQRVLTLSQSQGIPVVFVNLPMTQIYLDWTRSSYEQDLRTLMQNYARAGQLTFYDLGQRWPTRHDYFMDPSHLNRDGAAAVSRELGQTILPDVLKQY